MYDDGKVAPELVFADFGNFSTSPSSFVVCTSSLGRSGPPLDFLANLRNIFRTCIAWRSGAPWHAARLTNI